MENTETEPAWLVVARSATNKNFPAGSITIMAGTTAAGPGLNGTGLPTGVVFPLELTLNVRMPVVLPGHEEFDIKDRVSECTRPVHHNRRGHTVQNAHFTRRVGWGVADGGEVAAK